MSFSKFMKNNKIGIAISCGAGGALIGSTFGGTVGSTIGAIIGGMVGYFASDSRSSN